MEAGLVDVSNPDHVDGNGTPESGTSAVFVDAVAQGGITTFDYGAEPVTIVLSEAAKVFNNTGSMIVIDGGDLVTMNGGGEPQILYTNTSGQNQAQPTPHCQNQDLPLLTVQNLFFTDGNTFHLRLCGTAPFMTIARVSSAVGYFLSATTMPEPCGSQAIHVVPIISIGIRQVQRWNRIERS